MSAPPPTYEAAPGSPLAATGSPNLPPHPPSSTARPTTSGLLLEQVCAHVRRDPHSTLRPSPPNLCLSLPPITSVHPQMRKAREQLTNALQERFDPLLVQNFRAMNLGFEDKPSVSTSKWR